jgi:hypothetical protein
MLNEPRLAEASGDVTAPAHSRLSPIDTQRQKTDSDLLAANYDVEAR